jgi:FkbH-like protein
MTGATVVPRPVKCVVWDLDETLWSGVLAEGDDVTPRHGVLDVVKTLDERGILQSVASRNDPDRALDRLRQAGLAEYFLHPQVNWGAKSDSIARIAAELGLGLDAFLFVDDDPVERHEVVFVHPLVRVVESADLYALLDRPDLNPPYVTDEARQRRALYRADQWRRAVEESFTGPREAFLSSLGLVLTIRRAGASDLDRAGELTVRTHQLNATGYTYSRDELDALRRSTRHRLLVAELSDRFGSYGVIGVVVLEFSEAEWRLKLLLMSCRVMNRGVGAVVIAWLVREAVEAGVRLVGEFLPTDRNRAMFVTYRFAGFRDAGEERGVRLLESTATAPPKLPAYVALRAEPIVRTEPGEPEWS